MYDDKGVRVDWELRDMNLGMQFGQDSIQCNQLVESHQWIFEWNLCGSGTRFGITIVCRVVGYRERERLSDGSIRNSTL